MCQITRQVRLQLRLPTLRFRRLSDNKMRMKGAHLGDLQPLTVGAWIISSRALKPSSCPDELTTTNPILWGILCTGAVDESRKHFKIKELSNTL